MRSGILAGSCWCFCKAPEVPVVSGTPSLAPAMGIQSKNGERQDL